MCPAKFLESLVGSTQPVGAFDALLAIACYGFVVVFAVHDLKEFVNTDFSCFKLVFGCEKEEAALELRPCGACVAQHL